MIPAIQDVMLAISSSPAASIAVKATAITGLALVGTKLAHRSRAAVRHTILAAALGVLLVLPLVYFIAPPLRVIVPASVQERPALGSSSGAIRLVARSGGRDVSTGSRPAGISLSSLLLAGLMLGSALVLMPMVKGLWRIRAIRKSALPWRDGKALADGLVLDAGIRRGVEVLLHPDAPGPMTCGVLHPAIVLPQAAESWTTEDLERAFVHELEHVRRADWVSHCLGGLVCAMYWFHPLVWMAWRRLGLEAERACDDAVLRRSEATGYADQLVALARQLSMAAKSPFLAMANRADLAARVRAVLNGRQQRGRAGAIPVAIACAAAAVLAATMAPLQVVAAQQPAAVDARTGPVPRMLATTILGIVDVTVSDANGKSIEGLGANDFVLTEDGTPQTIRVFEYQKATGAATSSYYILGYYSMNLKMDGRFRQIKIVRKGDPSAKLDYRAGYYANSPNRTDVPDAGRGGRNQSATPDRYPVLLHKLDPEYSDEARKAKYQGSVVLFTEIDPSGRATSIKVRRSLGLGLDEQAINAVKEWKFRPGTKDGKPVTSPLEVELNFRLF